MPFWELLQIAEDVKHKEPQPEPTSRENLEEQMQEANNTMGYETNCVRIRKRFCSSVSSVGSRLKEWGKSTLKKAKACSSKMKEQAPGIIGTAVVAGAAATMYAM